jgi:hypothetical protein
MLVITIPATANMAVERSVHMHAISLLNYSACWIAEDINTQVFT